MEEEVVVVEEEAAAAAAEPPQEEEKVVVVVRRFVVMTIVMFVQHLVKCRPNKRTLHIFIVIEIIVIVITNLFTIGKRLLGERLIKQVHSKWLYYSLCSIFRFTADY